MRFKCSFGLDPPVTRTTSSTGNTMAASATAENASDDQPPHFRYHPNVNTRTATHAANSVTASQSIRNGSGFGGRSGRKNSRTRMSATTAIGTFTQKIHRQDIASLMYAVNNGVVCRVE